jgi:cell wall-associated NlpC family hydrolase
MLRPMSLRARLVSSGLIIAVALLMLACQPTTALPVTSGPRWACPSPTPLPTRIKESWPRPTTTPGIDPGADHVYYEPYEQEYGRPLRTPTPYVHARPNHWLGQRVEIWPLHARVTVEDGDMVGENQLHIIIIEWINHDAAPVPADYATRVRVRAVREHSGRIVTADTWGVSPASMRAAGIDQLPNAVPVGESTVRVPILAPPGTAEVVELTFLSQPGVEPALPRSPDVPISTATAESGPGDGKLPLITVQWSRGAPEPRCDHPGVAERWGEAAPVSGFSAPWSGSRVVQIALNQVGKPYIWGAKGPNAFDCSGLTQWAYAQVGIKIPAGTAGQWPGLPPVDVADARPGDLIFFDTLNAGRITHVGMLAGDLNGDGQWDMVHAASPEYGVRVDLGVFERPYYRKMFRGLRTVRR